MALLGREPSAGIPLPVERIHVEVTSRCNFDCEFCPQGDLARPSQDMPPSLLRSIVDQLEGGRIAREMHFHVMGEPLLYRHLAEGVAHAREKGVTTVVTTNGSLLDLAMARTLAEAGLSRLVVSLQTPDAESFKIRGAGSLTFAQYEEQIRQSVRYLVASHPGTEVVLGFRTTAFAKMQQAGGQLHIIDDNASLHAHLRAWLRELLRDAAPAPRLDGLLAAAGKASVVRWNMLRAAPNLLIETRPLGGWVKQESDRFHLARVGTCHALSEMFAVLSSGDLTFCCMDSEGETRVGNAKSMPLLAFFEHPEVLRIYRGFQSLRVLHPTCQRCLGEPGLFASLGHQLGSILYLRLFRERLKNRIDVGP